MQRAILASLFALVACGGSDDGSAGMSWSAVPTGQLDLAAGTNFATQLAVVGATGQVSFALLEGPPSLSLASTGELTYPAPLAELGTQDVRVSASDDSATIEQAFQLRVHQDVLLGTTYSPKGHEQSTTQADGIAYLTGHAPWGSVIGFHSRWRGPGQTMGELPGLIATAVAADAQFGVRPTFVIGWADGQGVPDLTSDSEPSNNTWSNAETRTEFTDMVVDLATSYQPEYLALANELDIWWEAHPGDLDQWLSLYSSVYDAVKAVSPQTKVYATFQYENLQGLGSFGAASWSAFDAMTSTLRLDLAAFTSYPYFEHASPSSIPSSYYDEIGLHWSGPVAFTEIGWLSAPSFPYPGSEMDQAAFVTQFFTRSAAYDLEFVQWLFLHDFDGQAAFPPFVGIGLRSNDASVVRPADAVWQAQVALREP